MEDISISDDEDQTPEAAMPYTCSYHVIDGISTNGKCEVINGE